MPDASGRFRGISVPSLPWQEDEQVKAINEAAEQTATSDLETPTVPEDTCKD